MYFKKYLVIAITLALMATANATTYTVSPDGNETNFSLSEAQNYANSNLGEEITFLLVSGDYGSLTDLSAVERDNEAWVNWKANEEGVVFDTIKFEVAGANYREIWQSFEGMTVKYGTPRVGKTVDLGVYMQNVGHTKFINMTFVGKGYVKDSGSTAISLGHANNAIIDNCTIYGETDAVEGGFETGINLLYSSNITVINCDISRCRRGINGMGRDWNISNNNIHDIDSDGIIISGGARIIIENNHIWEINDPGYGYHCDGIQAQEGKPPGDPQYIKMDNIVIRGNEIHGSDRHGMTLQPDKYDCSINDCSVYNSVIENNLVYDTDGTAVQIMFFKDLIYRNNTVIGKNWFRNNVTIDSITNNLMGSTGFFNTMDSVPAYENNNIVLAFGHPNDMHPDFVQGPNTLNLNGDQNAFEELFVDYNNFDFRPLMNKAACDGNVNQSPGTAVGAGPCVGEPPQECVNLTALTNYISQWKHGSLQMLSLMEKIEKWKTGEGC